MVAILSDRRTVEYHGLDLWTRWLFLAAIDDPPRSRLGTQLYNIFKQTPYHTRSPGSIPPLPFDPDHEPLLILYPVVRLAATNRLRK